MCFLLVSSLLIKTFLLFLHFVFVAFSFLSFINEGYSTVTLPKTDRSFYPDMSSLKMS